MGSHRMQRYVSYIVLEKDRVQAVQQLLPRRSMRCCCMVMADILPILEAWLAVRHRKQLQSKLVNRIAH